MSAFPLLFRRSKISRRTLSLAVETMSGWLATDAALGAGGGMGSGPILRWASKREG